MKTCFQIAECRLFFAKIAYVINKYGKQITDRITRIADLRRGILICR